jgi:hypothetical protein
MSLLREYDAARCLEKSKDAISIVSVDLPTNTRIQFDNVRIAGADDNENPAVMTGTVLIFGIMHHVMFFRVRTNDDGWTELDGDRDEELNNMLDSLSDFCDWDDMETVHLPGFSGEWLIGIHPSD